MEPEILSWTETIGRLLLAAFLGALIGLERERKNWSAGLRTHTMVSVGSCLIMIVSMYGFMEVLKFDKVELDPSRVAAQVISGIGFIGAGTILFLNRGVIRGLTTASGLWTVAAIGLATGSGLYFAASATSLIALLVLWGLQQLEQNYFKKFKQATLRIVTSKDSDNIFLHSLLTHQHLHIHSFTLDKKNEKLIFQIGFENIDIQKVNNLVQTIKDKPNIEEISWTQ